MGDVVVSRGNAGRTMSKRITVRIKVALPTLGLPTMASRIKDWKTIFGESSTVFPDRSKD